MLTWNNLFETTDFKPWIVGGVPGVKATNALNGVVILSIV